ncbi:MAG: caspase-like protein [Gemmatimonadetes bacterium]|jgi:hypothetical protein|nr:caspase-like protein [Gemmatimonadota bacterium]
MTEQQQPDESAAPIPDCPRCQGPMWDNRVGKRNPKAPDFKCKDKGCDGVVWPPRNATVPAAAAGAAEAPGAPADGGSITIRPPEPGMPACPLCGGAMWDDRASKRNPRAPDFKCRNKPRERGGPGCEGVIWPPRDGSTSPYAASAPRRTGAAGSSAPPRDDTPFPDSPPPFDDAPPHDDDDLPF